MDLPSPTVPHLPACSSHSPSSAWSLGRLSLRPLVPEPASCLPGAGETGLQEEDYGGEGDSGMGDRIHSKADTRNTARSAQTQKFYSVVLNK